MGDNLPNVDLNGETILQLMVGGANTCVIVTGGTVKCWGFNVGHGQGTTSDIGVGPGEMGANLPNVALGSGRSASQLYNAYGATCALLDDASVKCWGYGPDGRLGYEDTLSPRGNSPGTMGNSLPAVDLGTSFTPEKLAGGTNHICPISTTGTA
eukprot:6465244-Amphidinium_carterae.1